MPPKLKTKRTSAFQPKCRNPLHASWGSSNDVASDNGHLLNLSDRHNFSVEDIKLMEERGFHNVSQAKSQKGGICQDCWNSIKASKGRVSVNADHAYATIGIASMTSPPASSTESVPTTSEQDLHVRPKDKVDVPSGSVEAPQQNISDGTSGSSDNDLVLDVIKLINSNAIPQVIMIFIFQIFMLNQHKLQFPTYNPPRQKNLGNSATWCWEILTFGGKYQGGLSHCDL